MYFYVKNHTTITNESPIAAPIVDPLRFSVAQQTVSAGASSSGERRRRACRLRNSRNSSFMARTRASTSSPVTARARVRSGVDGVGVRVARSHS